jgi:hypothetical protein
MVCELYTLSPDVAPFSRCLWIDGEETGVIQAQTQVVDETLMAGYARALRTGSETG